MLVFLFILKSQRIPGVGTGTLKRSFEVPVHLLGCLVLFKY